MTLRWGPIFEGVSSSGGIAPSSLDHRLWAGIPGNVDVKDTQPRSPYPDHEEETAVLRTQRSFPETASDRYDGTSLNSTQSQI